MRKLIFVAAALCLALQAIWYWRYLSDDAYISLRYAQRLLDGMGLTWTDGERVEGYSNLSWVLACAALGRIGFDLEVAARLLGFGGMLGALWLVIRAQRTLAAGAVAGIAFAVAGPIAVWTVGGLEPPFEAVFLAWAIYEALAIADDMGSLRRAGLPLAALAITRPDGLLWTGALVVALLIVKRSRKVLRLIIAPVVAALGQLLFRVVYYHAWLPNTAWGKLRFGPSTLATGLSYLVDGALGLLGLLLLALLGLSFGERKRSIVIALPLVCWLGYVAAIGGDFMPAHRLLVPAVVLLCCAAGEFVAAFGRLGRDARIRGWLFTGVALSLFAVTQFYDPENLFARAQTWSRDGLRLGEILRRGLGERRPLIALDAAGAIAYASRLPALDMLGLCDSWIARHPRPASRGRELVGHSLGDGDYVLRRQPDVVVFCGPWGGEPCFSGGQEMKSDPRFAEYEPITVGAEGFQSRVFMRRHGRAGIRAEAELVIPGWLFANVPGNQARLDGEGRLEGVLHARAEIVTGRAGPAVAAEPEPRDAPVTITVSDDGKVTVTPRGEAHLRAVHLR
jgi:hypothetical protein